MAGSVHYRNLSDNTIISIIMSKYHKYEGCVLMNKNKKLHMSVFVFLSIFSLFVYTPLHSAASETDAIVVGVPVDRCPVIYEDNGKITGIGVDLITEAAKMADIKITVKPLVGETLKDALDNDNYDIVMPFGSAIESTSGKKSILTDNLFTTPFTLVTLNNKSIDLSQSLEVGMLSSQRGVAETIGKIYPNVNIHFYETVEDEVKAVRKGKVKALLNNSYVWSYILQKPTYEDLEINSNSIFTMDFKAGAIDSPKNRKLIDRLNKGIAGISESKRQAIILDYTSQRLYHYKFVDYLYAYWAQLLCILLFIVVIVMIAVEINLRMKRTHEEAVRRLIDYDPLTGAFSYQGFRKKVKMLLQEHGDLPYTISISNIRSFKFINERFGMDEGDELLKYWVKVVGATLGEFEAMARTSGDRFVILRIDGGEEKTKKLTTAAVDKVRNYFIDKGLDYKVQITTGIYILTEDDYVTLDIDHMLDCARLTQHKLKANTMDGYALYNPQEWEKDSRVNVISSHLTDALKAGEVEVWYQPQVEFNENTMSGAEALCRWNHPDLGKISPAEFIGVLEATGQIYELDTFMWDRVCKDLKRWNDAGKHMSVSVNLARNDISAERDIPGQFRSLIEKYGLKRDQLRIEITESAYMDDANLLIDTAKKLREYGFVVEMDDFGSGYSSLNMLKEVPVDVIKLDLRFLSEKGDREKGRNIVGFVVKLIKSLGMDIIAEGVENSSQSEFLKSIGCSCMQGYYFYKPMPVEEFDKIINGDLNIV